MLRIQRYHIVWMFGRKKFGEFLFVCFLYLCHKTLLRIWTVKFGELPVISQIRQGFPPPMIHTIWYFFASFCNSGRWKVLNLQITWKYQYQGTGLVVSRVHNISIYYELLVVWIFSLKVSYQWYQYHRHFWGEVKRGFAPPKPFLVPLIYLMI